MSTSAFGEHLRRERELRGVSLEEVSAATRISIGFLEALERGDWAKLPGGVFRRGFIRSVGRFLGLDEESLIAEYSLETRDTPQAVLPVKAAGPDARHGLFFGGIAAAILLIIALFFVWRYFVHRGSSPPAKPERHAAAMIAPWGTPSVSSASGKFVPRPANPDFVSGSIAKPDGVPKVGPVPQMPFAPSAPSGSPTAKQAEPIASAAPGSPQPGILGDAPLHSSPLISSPPSMPDSASSSSAQNAPVLLPSGLSLHIQASRETRVRILADGEEIYKGTMTPGQWRNFRAVQSMEIFADDGGAIQLELNGKPVRDNATTGRPLHVTLPLAGAGAGVRP